MAGEGDGLQTDIGLLEAVAIEVGLIIGAGLFALTGVATGIAGAGVVVSYVLSFAVVCLGLFPTAVLAATYPTVAGNYRYPRDLVSPHVAFLAAWGLTVSMFGGGLPLYALSFGEYVNALVPVAPRLVAVAALTFFFAVNLLGIRPAAQLQVLLFGTLVGSILVFVLGGLPAVSTANLTPLAPNGAVGVVTGAAVLYFVCLGANFVVDLGGEVRAAAVTIPTSFLVSVPTALVLYVGTALVAVGAVGPGALAGQTLDVAATAVLPGPLATLFIVGGALFATATTLNAVFMIAPKYLLALADDGLMPAALSRVNDRWGTPHVSLALVYAVTTLSVFSPLPFAELGSLLGFGGIFLIVPVMLAAVQLVRERPGDLRAAPLSVPGRLVAGVAVAAVACNAVLFVLLGQNTTGVLAVWLAAMVAGEGYYQFRRRVRGGDAGAPAADSILERGEQL